ncbi:MAG: hypothetical protein ETSY2_43110 [Candidatus Entotheonella gemina]|uniref:Blue (type 1) copper domain-containing protein n=1 Tax=Candidatus Entotheonella gemina TaxID=1429439 RepID=W4LJT7_9BACT|nr:MAG: hypothetical protein ETSY2_43110 [Candidatus Entotheonella gemina]
MNGQKISVVALCGLVAAIFISSPVWAEEIFVDAVMGIKWEANCERCTQVGRNVEISVKPGDIIVFRQVSNLPHGVMEVSGEADKIRKSGEDGNNIQIVEEISRIGAGTRISQIPITTHVEITRMVVKDNFAGSLQLQCNVHFNAMTVTLKKD